MNEVKWAIITGADGGMGTEITRAVATAGYHVIMACYNPQKAENVCQRLMKETGNPNLEVLAIDLSSMHSVASFTDRILERKLTRKLVPTMASGARIVNMVSCTYAIGRLDFPDFFHRGKTGNFWRIPVYSNTKLALLLFTFELSEQLREKGITVNAADPGIVSTDIITMHKWFDPLTDIFFRPFIRKPKKGASTAIGLLLDKKETGVTGQLYVNNHRKSLSDKYVNHVQKEQLWEITERLLAQWLE